MDGIFLWPHRATLMSKVGDNDEPVGRLKEMIRANERQLKQTRETLATLNARPSPPAPKPANGDSARPEKSAS
jgi:hypothetical protein